MEEKMNKCKTKGCRHMLKIYDKEFCTECVMNAIKAVTMIKVENIKEEKNGKRTKARLG